MTLTSSGRLISVPRQTSGGCRPAGDQVPQSFPLGIPTRLELLCTHLHSGRSVKAAEFVAGRVLLLNTGRDSRSGVRDDEFRGSPTCYLEHPARLGCVRTGRSEPREVDLGPRPPTLRDPLPGWEYPPPAICRWIRRRLACRTRRRRSRSPAAPRRWADSTSLSRSDGPNPGCRTSSARGVPAGCHRLPLRTTWSLRASMAIIGRGYADQLSS